MDPSKAPAIDAIVPNKESDISCNDWGYAWKARLTDHDESGLCFVAEITALQDGGFVGMVAACHGGAHLPVPHGIIKHRETMTECALDLAPIADAVIELSGTLSERSESN